MCILKTHKVKTAVHLKDYNRYELSFVRKTLGFTLEEIGAILGCGKQTLSDIENGVSGFKSPRKILYGMVLEEICKERGTSFEEVLKERSN